MFVLPPVNIDPEAQGLRWAAGEQAGGSTKRSTKWSCQPCGAGSVWHLHMPDHQAQALSQTIMPIVPLHHYQMAPLPNGTTTYKQSLYLAYSKQHL